MTPSVPHVASLTARRGSCMIKWTHSLRQVVVTVSFSMAVFWLVNDDYYDASSGLPTFSQLRVLPCRTASGPQPSDN